MNPPASGSGTMDALLVVGLFLFVAVLACLGAGLLLFTSARGWVERCADAAHSRRTATLLLGAGLGLALFVAVTVCSRYRLHGLAATSAGAAALVFTAGFAADALRTGRRITSPGSGPATVLVLGWIARSAALAAPLLWPLTAAYLLVSALGAPLAGWIGPKSSTEPSSGISPER